MTAEKMTYFFNTLDNLLTDGKPPSTALALTVKSYADVFFPGSEPQAIPDPPTIRNDDPIRPADCTCAYPKLIARNPSGHAPGCPVYERFWGEMQAGQVEPKRANAEIVGRPTPPEVHEAMNVIRAYLKRGGWVQVIINAEGGASFRLTDIYEDVLPGRG